MRPPRLAGVVLSLLAITVLDLAASPRPLAAAEDAAALRDQVLDPLLSEKARVKSAQSLVKADAEMLGGALLELGEKQKNPAHLPFLVAYTVQEEARHLRLLATWAAWMSAPDRAAAGFLERSGAEDEREAIRAVEAAGFVAAATRDRETWPKFAEIARAAKSDDGDDPYRVQVGIEAARALNRTMDPRVAKFLIDAACATGDNHVRKHLTWGILDLEGDDRGATKIFEGLRGRTGNAGKNASECVQVLLDKQATPFQWKADALKGVGAWWKTGRPRGLQPEIAIKDDQTKLKINGWIAEMKKEVPGWEHYVRCALPKIAYRADKDYEVFNLKKLTMNIESSEILRCESAWQGSYVLARAAGIAFSAQFGEPSRDHRGWEPAYVDLYSFMKSTKQSPGKLSVFIDESMAKKAWP